MHIARPRVSAWKKQEAASKNGETIEAGRLEYPLSFGRLLSRWRGKKRYSNRQGVACGVDD
jgi:hypothetical protein